MKNLTFTLPVLTVLLFGCDRNSTPSDTPPPAKTFLSQTPIIVQPAPSVVILPPNDQDRKITADIHDMLNNNSSISPENKAIEITTNDGVVTLNGQVTNQIDKSSIEMMARSANGVRRVDSHLTISK